MERPTIRYGARGEHVSVLQGALNLWPKSLTPALEPDGIFGVKTHSKVQEFQRQEGTTPDGNYEAEVFRAKVYAAVRMVERECEFTEFTIYRMRVFDGMSGKDVAESVGTSEPTVSRRLTKVRDLLRRRLAEVVATYSFTTDEQAEAERNGLALSPNKADDAMFDEAIAELYHREEQARRAEQEGLMG